jgi:preprotein translocase subunit SecG
MQVVTTVLVALQMLSALVMIGLILVQHGKGADMGAAFGSGSSGSLFGASGSANFMSRATAVLAAVFFVCTLALAYFSGVRPMNSGSGSVLEKAGISAPAGAASGSAPIPTGVTTPAGPAAVPSGVASGAASSAASAATGTAPIPTK